MESFDGIAVMRAIRDRMNEELADMTAEEVWEWFDSYEYKSPIIKRFVEYHKSRTLRTITPPRVQRGRSANPS